MSTPKGAFSKHPHRRGCDGGLYRIRETVSIDSIGRVDNGGLVAHDYRCNMAWWEGCGARVLVTEGAVRLLAVAVEERVTDETGDTDGA